MLVISVKVGSLHLLHKSTFPFFSAKFLWFFLLFPLLVILLSLWSHISLGMFVNVDRKKKGNNTLNLLHRSISGVIFIDGDHYTDVKVAPHSISFHVSDQSFR